MVEHDRRDLRRLRTPTSNLHDQGRRRSSPRSSLGLPRAVGPQGDPVPPLRIADVLPLRQSLPPCAPPWGGRRERQAPVRSHRRGDATRGHAGDSGRASTSTVPFSWNSTYKEKPQRRLVPTRGMVGPVGWEGKLPREAGVNDCVEGPASLWSDGVQGKCGFSFRGEKARAHSVSPSRSRPPMRWAHRLPTRRKKMRPRASGRRSRR